jgi:serine/threonine-protein kinase
MIPFLSDSTLAHLRQLVETPDLTGTPYEMEREIGRGGMGVVYLAHDRRLQRAVALKIVEALDPLREARTLATLEHPGIVPIHDAGELADGRAYYAMRYVQGSRLDAYRDAHPPLRERLSTFLKIADAVAYAHSRGVTHRDLKPANIMTGCFGEVFLLDWGLARAPITPLEAPGTVLGTPHFMAPELAHGGAAQADHRVDLYSLGKILEWLLPDDAPPPLRAIARHAAADAPNERYAEVTDLQADLNRWLDGYPVSAYRESPWERLVRFTGRHRPLVYLLLVYVLIRFFLFFSSLR